MTAIKNKLLAWFTRNATKAEEPYSASPSASQDLSIPGEEGEITPSVAGQPVDPMQRVRETVQAPTWLTDEDTLRDEGILFGLSGSDPTEKTEIIQHYFYQISAGLRGQIEQKNEEIQEYNLFIGQKDEGIQDLKKCIGQEVHSSLSQDHYLPRTLLGLLLSTVVCFSNYFLIYNALLPSYPGTPLIALGVFCAGMFNLFSPLSFFHDTEKKVSWRVLIEELGLPLAAASFVLVHSLQYQQVWQAWGQFVFVLFLFLFSGKLLLSNVTLIHKNIQSWLKQKTEQRKAKGLRQAWIDELRILEEEMSQLRVKRWQALREQGVAEAQREELLAQRDMLIKIFESEYYLARGLKGQLSGKELNFIQDSRE
ncbi:hypothetical protein [Dyadobacter tibetensis]|uniref:hypothetical protein n=1 Tax=Dyadobacter tibetensis TaxID=1211851 RepID=UPI00046F093F|nr:hypothetical protein [Dyadobacter tibetensis]